MATQKVEQTLMRQVSQPKTATIPTFSIGERKLGRGKMTITPEIKVALLEQLKNIQSEEQAVRVSWAEFGKAIGSTTPNPGGPRIAKFLSMVIGKKVECHYSGKKNELTIYPVE